MRLHTYYFIFCLLLIACQTPPETKQINPLEYVDPFIGTGFHGHTFPGSTLPFGMVQLSPDTRLPGWDASSGYHYSDSTIYGFSHTHLSGTGIGDMGDILMLPYTGSDNDSLLAYFDKSTEQASPGYYAVELKNFDVKAELTSSLRVGMHRYTYPDNEAQKLLIDLGHILQANWGHRSLEGEIEVVDNQTIKGKRVSSGWANDHPVYFFAVFSSPFEMIKATDQGKEIETNSLKGKELKTWLTFPQNTSRPLLIKVGISSVDTEGAKKNLEAEIDHWDFERVRKEAEEAWKSELGKIAIQTPNQDVLENFYTAFYHSMVAPMTAQDVDGRYRGMDKQIHQAPKDFTNYTVFSLWDTFRAFHPLMSIIDTKRSNEWAKALIQKYKEGGVLPKWPLAANYTGTMVGYPAASVLADLAVKNIGDFDKALALEAAIFSSEYHPEVIERHPEPRMAQVMPKHIDFINRLRFIPGDSISASVSYGLECAYYDWCIAQIANQLGEEDIEKMYLSRAKYYQQYFDPETGFMRAKLANGEFREPFNPKFSDHEMGAFVEGNAWQWSWFVPHDIDGFMELMGGKEAFATKMDSLFATSSEIEGERASADITGLIGQYAHGNEPSHHVTHFYNYAGQSWKTQEKVDEVLQTLYAPTPEGISGNEDCGQMSAWYVLNALGFYQVCPGDPTYSIGRPIIDFAEIQLENGGIFTVEVVNNSLQNKYISSIELNGEKLETPFFPHQAIIDGGKLRIFMSDKIGS